MSNTPENHDDRETLVDAAFADYLSRLDTGKPVDLEAFLKQNESIAQELRELIEMESTVESMASGDWTENTKHFRGEANDSDATIPADVTIGNTTDSAAPGIVKLFGEYELIEILGRGGMGIVYKARQKSINRFVALKMIIGGKYSTEDSVRRFYVEAKAAGKLSHPNIVRAFEAGEHDGRHFFAMELIEGITLRDMLKNAEDRLPFDTIVGYMKQLADAVHFAHEKGVLHRDLKPSNIIVNKRDVPKIADFGLAKHVDPDAGCSFESSTGAVIGTPSYMSPEQAAAKRDEVGPASDIYSLGAIFYELLTGAPPFHGDSPVATLLLVVNQEVKPPSDINPNCHPGLEAICLKCLEKDPNDRYESGRELADDLERYLTGEPVRARHLTPFHRAWVWFRAIPMVSVALGRHPGNSTKLQRGVQWVALALFILVCITLFSRSAIKEYLYLRDVQIGVGHELGEYDRIGRMIRDVIPDADGNVDLLNSGGSVASRKMLLDFEVDLCVLQDNTMTRKGLAIVTPLFQEAVLVIVNKESDIRQVADLEGKPIALGRPESGSRITSDRILSTLQISTSPEHRDRSWTELLTNEGLAGAIGTVARRDSRLQAILASGRFRMIPLAIDRLPDWLRPHRFVATDFPPAANVPPGGLESATVEAVLAVRSNSPSWFVTQCLNQIYFSKKNSLAEHILSVEDASNWTAGRALHPASHRFFEKHTGVDK